MSEPTRTTFTPDLAIRLPRRRHGIALIGAGSIAEHGHFPAYQKFGLDVLSVASRTPGKAAQAATKWRLPFASDDWREAIDREGVEIVDLTYPYDEERLPIIEYAASRGKHLMIQKPLAHSMERAQELVAIARRAGVLMAVNQNARWAPPYRAARQAIERGLIGQPYSITHQIHSSQDSAPWFQRGWYASGERFQIMEYAIHHLDLARWWMDREPTRVRCAVARKPNQHARGEMVATIVLSFADDAIATLVEHNAAHPTGEALANFVIEGTDGSLRGQSMPQPSLKLERDGVEDVALSGSWFPDSFAGTMGELMCAIEEGREPSISAEENLGSLKLVFDAYADAGKRHGQQS